MSKRYQIKIDLESAAATKSVRDFRAELEKADKAGERLGRRLGPDFAKASPQVRKFTGDITATTTAYAGLGRQAVAALDQVVTATKRATQATKDKQKIDIGGYKFIADSLKRSAKLEQDARAQQIQWERKHVIDIDKVKASGFKAASDQIEKHRKDYEDAKKKQIEWERKNVIDVTQMHASAMKSKSASVEKQFKDEEAVKKRWLDWEKKNVTSIGQLEASAQHVKSKSIDLQLQAQQKYQQGFTKALTDQEIAQSVANAKMQRSNDARSKAAMKAAGIEVEGHRNVISGLASMVTRYAAYHLLIGKTTQLVNVYSQAVKEATQAQDKMLSKFTDEVKEERQAAATLGKVAGPEFHKEIKDFQVATGMDHGEALGFYRAIGETSAQYIQGPNDPKDAAGKTATEAQHNAIALQGGRYASAHGLTQESAAQHLGEVIGARDYRGMPVNKAVETAMGEYVGAISSLEHGKGANPALQKSFSQFFMGHKEQFRTSQDAAAFISTIAQGMPPEKAATAAEAMIASLQNPNEDMKKLLQKVEFQGPGNAGGRLMGRGKNAAMSNDVRAQDALEAIRAHYDKMGLKGLQRENQIGKDFNLRRGSRGAVQFLSESGAVTFAERMAFGQAHSTPAAIEADLAKRFGSEDMRLSVENQKAAQAQSLRNAKDQRLRTMSAEAATARQLSGATGSTKEASNRGFRETFGMGTVDMSEQRELQVTSQELLLREIEKLNPKVGAAERKKAFGNFTGVGVGSWKLGGAGVEDVKKRLHELDATRNDLRKKAGLPARGTILDMDQLKVRDPDAMPARPGAQASRVGSDAFTPSGGYGADNASLAAIAAATAEQTRLLKAIYESGQQGRQVSFNSPSSLPLGFMPTQILS